MKNKIFTSLVLLILPVSNYVLAQQHPHSKKWESEIKSGEQSVETNFKVNDDQGSAEQRKPYACESIKIKSGLAQLFVDDFLIDEGLNLKRTLHQPKKDNDGNFPILELEDEFEGYGATLMANGTIIYDPRLKKYVMFAESFSKHKKEIGRDQIWDCARLYRFTSKDGINWIKGDNGRPQLLWPLSKEDLKVTKTGSNARNIDLFSCYYDPNDKKYPYKGWLWFDYWEEEQECARLMRSSDGINWKCGEIIIQGFSRIINQDGRVMSGPRDVTFFYHDPVEDRFLAMMKFMSKERVEYDNQLRSRAYAFLEKIDEPFDTNQITHIELLPPAAEANGDMPHDQYYSSTGWRYESQWLGLLKIWHAKDDYPYSAAGCAFFKLLVSRDGLHWEKVQFPNDDGVPEVFIPNGPEGGNKGRNDGGYMTDFTQGPLRIGDELIYYYGCSSYGKNQPKEMNHWGGGIFRSRLRLDGFVSVDGGVLTTKPLSFKGQNLYVNGTGPIMVEVLDACGKRLGSSDIIGDSLNHKVKFAGKSLRKLSQRSPAKLRFTVYKGGELYSFRVGKK
jgi:hypothetical protein